VDVASLVSRTKSHAVAPDAKAISAAVARIIVDTTEPESVDRNVRALGCNLTSDGGGGYWFDRLAQSGACQ
jgi:hypothetical protein